MWETDSTYVDPYGAGEFSQYVPSENVAVSDTGWGGDFFTNVSDKLSSVLGTATPTGGSTVRSTLFDAIYAYGAGKVDYARQKVASAFLMTSEGQKFQQAGVQQTLQKYLPLMLVALAGLFVLGLMLGRR